MEKESIVPFGKYKGRDTSEMLSDSSYIGWLKLQPWLAKYPNIQNIVFLGTNISNTDQPTPEHNRLQNTFLNNAMTEALVDKVMPTRRSDLARLNKLKMVKLLFGNVREKLDVIFEGYGGWDVVISYTGESVFPGFGGYYKLTTMKEELSRKYRLADKSLKKDLKKDRSGYDSSSGPLCYEIGDYRIYVHQTYPGKKIWPSKDDKLVISDATIHAKSMALCLELKTTLGDDYPCVLRKMKRQIETSRRHYWPLTAVLVVERFYSEYTSKEELQKIFGSSGIKIIFLEEETVGSSEIKVVYLDDEVEESF